MTEPDVEYVICEVTEDGRPRSSVGASLVVTRWLTKESAIKGAKDFSVGECKLRAFKLEPLE